MKKRLLPYFFGLCFMTIYAGFHSASFDDFVFKAISWNICLDILIFFCRYAAKKDQTKKVAKDNIKDEFVNLDDKKPAYHQETSVSTELPKRPVSYHKQFKVAGVTFKSMIKKTINRQEVLKFCSKNSTFYLQEYQYNKKPAFLVVCKEQELDIGSVPADLVSTVLKYKDRDTAIKCIDIDYFEEGRKKIYFAKMQFIVYK